MPSGIFQDLDRPYVGGNSYEFVVFLGRADAAYSSFVSLEFRDSANTPLSVTTVVVSSLPANDFIRHTVSLVRRGRRASQRLPRAHGYLGFGMQP